MGGLSIERQAARLLAGYSAEVTTPDRQSLDRAVEAMPKGTAVYIASLPRDSFESQLAMARQVRELGFEPVPHIVARTMASRSILDEGLLRLSQEAGVSRALVLGGDRPDSVGPFETALDLLRTEAFARAGIGRVAFGCYPEGHPRVSSDILERELLAKIGEARAQGLDARLVSQFAFEAAPIVSLVRRLRDRGVTTPLRVGVAGPASVTKLLRYAKICGIGSSVRALSGRGGMVRNLLAQVTPRQLIFDLAEALVRDPGLDILGIHLFTFASLADTVHWIERELSATIAA